MPVAKEFPDFKLDIKLPRGFVDSSWRHNAKPSFDRIRIDGKITRLWIDYADVALRDSKAGPDRFVVETFTVGDDWISTDFQTSDHDALMQHLASI